MNAHVLKYIRIPNLSLLQMQRVGKTLVRDKPQETNDAIEIAATDLVEHIAVVDVALTTRLQATNTELLKAEGLFDRGMDALWIYLIRMIEGAQTYAHPGLDVLPEKLAVQANLAAARVIAKKARHLHQRLFGSSGTAFTQYSYVEQAESMAAIHRLITDEDLHGDLVAVVGPQLPALLEACQVHYEDMVSNRLGREQTLVGNLRELRSDLRWYIGQYNNAVCTLLRRKQPETEEIVEQALRAVTSLRGGNTISGSGPADEDVDAPEELDALDVPADAPAPDADADAPDVNAPEELEELDD